jgi:TolB-like protein/class 3 adenylate cyclase
VNPEGVERKLAAILSADVVGYSRLMAEDEAGTIRTLTAYREAIGSLVQQHHGRVVDSPGDNLLAEFPNALDAVQGAVEIQGVLRVRNQSLPEDRRMLFRIGVHLGDITTEGDRVYGDGINIAARLEGLADAGGICISANVYDQVRHRLELGYDDLGEQEVKNLPDPVRVFRVNLKAEVAAPGAPSRSWRRTVLAAALLVLLGAVTVVGWRMFAGRLLEPTAAAIPSSIRSIAVLPLENLSGDPAQEYFADSMTEALIGDLAKLGSLSVISRTSVMRYKQSDKSLPEIAKELNVDGVVEGTVMRAGDRVRITAQLIDARNDTHLWSNRYDRELSDVLALQSEVARAVAEQVRLELTSEEQAALTASRPVDPRAYDAYLRGLQLRGPTSLVAAWGPPAVAQFEQAVALDPDFAEGYAALAVARRTLGVSGFERRYRSELPKAREAAQRALELDDRLGGAHAVLGWVRLYYDWDFPGARRASERALQLSPSDPAALKSYQWYLLWVEGRAKEALDLSERLLRVAPFDPYYRSDRFRLFHFARQYERALEEVERVRELDPDFVDVDIANTYFALGQIEEGFREQIAFWERCGAPCDWQLEAQERGWAEGGWDGALRAWLEAAMERGGYSPWMIALNYTLIGETDEAFAWLERAYRDRDPLMVALRADARFDPLRSDPHFDDLLRRMGFPES